MPNPRASKPSSSLLITFLSLIIILTTLIYFLQTSSTSLLSPIKKPHPNNQSSSTPPNTQSPPQSLNHLSPPSKTVVFSEHPEYENISHVYDGLWDELLPENGGFLRVLGLEDGNGEGKGEKKKHKYGITMFHSLHCLGIMRGGVQELFREMEDLRMEVEELGGREGMEKIKGREMGRKQREMREKEGNEMGKREGAGHDFGHTEHGDPLHWLHCFDYLRQTILCTADGTLEPPKTDLRGKENVDGMMERQCKDPEELWRLSVESFEDGG